MSNVLAIATVTETLRRSLGEALKTDLTGASGDAEAKAVRPGTPGNVLPSLGVNVFLYQVLPNAALRGIDLPARRENGSAARRPQTALNLHYLLSCYGEETNLEPQRVLASITRTLHAKPLITRAMIARTIKKCIAENANHYLKNSDLADEVEIVRLTPLSLNLEELSKLWSVFFQTPYVLSVAYLASVVLIDGDDVPQPALPVSGRNLYGTPFRQPVIDQIMPEEGSDSPLLVDSTLVIRGQRLSGTASKVRLNDLEATPQSVSETRITLDLSTLPANSLRAGVLAVQVVQPMAMGTPPAPHQGVESNVATAVLRPDIVQPVTAANVKKDENDLYSADITVKVKPEIGTAQRVALLLNELTTTEPKAYTFASEPRSADSDSVIIKVSGVKAADYLVRIRVDGAESPLDLDPTSPEHGPRVTIP
jgi:hypothetical protein